jgi:hypothetical protein
VFALAGGLCFAQTALRHADRSASRSADPVELSINLNTARDMDTQLPDSLLLRYAGGSV